MGSSGKVGRQPFQNTTFKSISYTKSVQHNGMINPVEYRGEIQQNQEGLMSLVKGEKDIILHLSESSLHAVVCVL